LSATSARKRVFSGIQPSGVSHIGNYLGAIRNWVLQQDEYDSVFCIVNLHALTLPTDPVQLRENTITMANTLLAAGIDPARAVLFVQGDLTEHSEGCWLLNSVTQYGELRRMTQFKDKSGKDEEAVSAALFDYPALQAADILLYDAEIVPVGEDQRQHVELTRDLANRFNSRFGETFVIPEAMILKETARIYDLQEPSNKMSKSAATESGIIWLLDDPKVTAKKIKSAVTDDAREVRFDRQNKPGVSNLLTIYSVLSGKTIEALEQEYAGHGYGDLKKDLAEIAVETFAPVRARTLELLDDPAELDRVLAGNADRAAEIADATLAKVYDRIGLLPHAR